jgi:hypothetical protein
MAKKVMNFGSAIGSIVIMTVQMGAVLMGVKFISGKDKKEREK